MRYLSKEEINRALLNALKSKTHRDRNVALLQVLAKSGIRVSELNSITPKDLLSDESQLIIRGKGNTPRNVDIPIELVMSLENYIQNYRIKKTNRIFPLTRQQIRNITKKLADTNPHAFRHSYAIHLLRRTQSIKYVQNQLGHSSLATTEIYLKFMEFTKDKDKLEGMFEK